MKLNSRNIGSWCEALIVVLQGLMSSEVELADICQQNHVSVMGHNTRMGSQSLSACCTELGLCPERRDGWPHQKF